METKKSHNKYIIVVVKNISSNLNENHIKEIFNNYGNVQGCYIPKSEISRKNKDYAFVEYLTQEEANQAELYMDGGQVDGKIIEVECLDPKNYKELK